MTCKCGHLSISHDGRGFCGINGCQCVKFEQEERPAGTYVTPPEIADFVSGGGLVNPPFYKE